jgi:hypothetical protein
MASWLWDWKTGYTYAAPNIISGPEVTKQKDPLGQETWGPYKKTYTKSMFGQNLFRPPHKIDGVPILCRCRSIDQYIRDSGGDRLFGAAGALLVGTNRPACWEDSESIMNPSGGDTFNIIVGHPAFYAFMANRNGVTGLLGFGGRRKLKKLRKTRRKKRI